MKELQINQNFISIFASGNSLLDISLEEFQLFKKKSFVITTNFGPLRFNGDMNCWSDKATSIFLDEHYKTHQKDCLFLSREAAFSPGLQIRQQVDFWFDNRKENLAGNYTAGWLLQLIRKNFPNKTILLFGWDFYVKDTPNDKWYDAYTDYDRQKRGKSFNQPQKLLSFMQQLKGFNINIENIYNCNLNSGLDLYPKKHWVEVLGLNVLHLTNSPIAGAPVHLSKILNKYTSSSSFTILKNDFSKNSRLSNLSWEYDAIKPNPALLKEKIDWADFIHFHQKPYEKAITEKKSLIQFHAQPGGYIPEKTLSEFNDRKLVIAQYHPRFYSDARIVPNLIDIWDESYLPLEKNPDKIKIFYSWATEVPGGWGDKGSKRTTEILGNIKKQYKDRVEIVIFNNKSHRECMKEKQTAHICIDECVTGSYHLQSLEGCSVGAVTFNNIDEKTISFLASVSGTNSIPFIKSDINSLHENLSYYIDNPTEIEIIGKEARNWMEKWWDPKKMAGSFLQAYSSVICFGSLNAQKNKWGQNLPVSKIVCSPPAPLFQPHKTINKQIQTPTQRIPKQNHPNLQINIPNEKDYAHDFIPKSGKSIVDLFQKYSGEDIFIFGTGPSLFKINPEEYSNKICFSINYAFEHMPNIDYYLCHVKEVYDILRGTVDNEKLILPENLVGRFYTDRSKIRYKERVETESELGYIYPIQDPYERNIERKHVRIEKITRFFTWSTTTHSAIHIAAYMGAKNIYLIGMDYVNYPSGKVHFDSKYDVEFVLQDWSANTKHKAGDFWLAEQLTKSGIKLINLSKTT